MVSVTTANISNSRELRQVDWKAMNPNQTVVGPLYIVHYHRPGDSEMLWCDGPFTDYTVAKESYAEFFSDENIDWEIITIPVGD